MYLDVVDSALSATPSWLAYLNSGGVLGLVVLIAYAFFKRKVRTEGEVTDRDKMYEARLADAASRLADERSEKNDWKDSAMKQSDTNSALADQLTKVTDLLETVSQRGSA